jgi:hypothetical protein
MQTVTPHGHGHSPGFGLNGIEIARMSDAERVAEGIKRGVGKLPRAMQAQLRELVTCSAASLGGHAPRSTEMTCAISVDWIKDKKGSGAWVATIIPAREIRCGVRINDGDGQVVEAELLAMLRRSVVAHWQRGQST